VGDRSPLAAVLIVRCGSTGGSTSSSVVAAGEGDPLERRALHVLRRWPSHGSEGGPPSSDIRLVGGERDADPVLRVAHPMASALPWTTSASGAEIGRSVDLGTRAGVCGLATEGRHPVDMGKMVADRPAPSEIGGA
jgi:hypothetical protein